MRLPLPRNKLVALSIVGALLAVGGAVALASPGVFSANAAAPASLASAFSDATAALGEHDGYEHEDHDAYEHGEFEHDG